MTKNSWRLATFAIAVFGSSVAWAQSGASAGHPRPNDSQGAVDATVPPLDTVPPLPHIKHISKAEREKACHAYEGSYISYYDNVYKVEDCKRHALTSAEQLFQLTKNGVKIKSVPSEVISALPEAGNWRVSGKARTCKDLEGQYVTYSYVDVYHVEHCKKRLFPDWATYLDYRGKRGNRDGEILGLSEEEFAHLPSGRDMPPSVTPNADQDQDKHGEVDIIPIDEACAGVNNRYVSYYSRVYRIDKCRKREITDPTAFFMEHRDVGSQIKELTSEQWQSLPNGKPMDARPARQSTKE